MRGIRSRKVPGFLHRRKLCPQRDRGFSDRSAGQRFTIADAPKSAV